MLFLRIRIDGEKTFAELLSDVKREIAAAFEHRDFDRVPDLFPLNETDISFNWQTTYSKGAPLDHHVMLECADHLPQPAPIPSPSPFGHSSEADQLRILPFPARSPYLRKFDPVFFDTATNVHMVVTYDPGILTPLTIELFCRCLLILVKEICQNSALQIAPLLERIGCEWTKK